MKTRMVVVKCCSCRRIKVNNNWVREPDFLSNSLEHSHTYCPACLNTAMVEAESWAHRSGSSSPPAPAAANPESVH